MDLYVIGNSWFATRFIAYEQILPDGEGSVRLSRRISEKISRMPGSDGSVGEGVAVYEAAYFKNGEPVGREAIVKIYMQIPFVHHHSDLSENPDDYAAQAQPFPNDRWGGFTEIDALSTLTDSGCKSTPKIYDWFLKHGDASDNPWIKGGYLGLNIMEKLPGVNLRRYWRPYSLSEEEQVGVRGAFKIALTELWRHGYESGDPRSANLLWDSDNSKCYIVDFEDTFDAFPVDWDEHADITYSRWQLTKEHPGW